MTVRGAGTALALATSALLLAACSGVPKKGAAPAAPGAKSAASVAPAVGPAGAKVSPYAPAQEDPGKRGDYTRGGLYAPHIADSAPDEVIDVDAIPEPQVRPEPRGRYGNRSPYVVLGKSYTVRDTPEGYVEQGLASYYGKKFHGRRTSNLEVYDMYAFSAAHKSLPLPSFARVTNLANGKSVVVRVNDRGPFHAGRIIDLSYAAAVKLDVHRAGTAKVEVRGLGAGEQAHEAYDAIAARAPAKPRDMPVPAPSAPASLLPPGVRVATGRPAPVLGSGAPMGAAGTAIDKLIGVLPIASASAGERAPGGTAPPAGAAADPVAAKAYVPAPLTGGSDDWRFDMRQDGQAMTADEFDTWMKSRRARVATGKPAAIVAEGAGPSPGRVAAPIQPAAVEVAQAAPLGAAPAMAPVRQSPIPTATPAAGITLQVAAFGARGNAERALSMLRGAGIAAARLQDGQSNGQTVWRLRVGPVASTHLAELTARVAGLGFGRPQVVRE